MLAVNHLSIIRDDLPLFESLSFRLQAGDILQIEGENGAGKTSLLRVIAGLGKSGSGEVLWQGEPIAHQRDVYHQSMLFIGHLTGVKRELTALENLRFYQTIAGKPCSDDELMRVLAKVGLVGREDVVVAHLSAGQQRRVALARLWLSDHLLWILDEPFAAIDAKGIKVLEALFVKHAQQGGMVLLTTHQALPSQHAMLQTLRLDKRQ